MRRHEADVGWLCGVPPPGKTVSAELLAPGLIIGAAFESAYPVAKGNYYDIEARWPTTPLHNAHAHAHVACTCTCTHGMCMCMSMSSSTSTSTSRPALHDHARACSPLTSPHPHTRRATRRATPPTSTWRASRQAAACRMLPVPPYVSLCLTIPRCISLHLPPGLRLEDAPASFFSGAALGPTGRFGSYAAPQAEGVRVRVRCGPRVRVRALRLLRRAAG